MTAASVSQGDLMRLLIAQVPGLARRSVPVPSLRLGGVTAYSTNIALVLLDGDAAPVAVQSAVPGGLFPGQRVVVTFYPPHGALVTGVMGEAVQPRGHVGAFTGSGSFAVLTPTLGSLLPIPRTLHAGRLYRAYVTCVWLADTAGTTLDVTLEARAVGAATWTIPVTVLRDTNAVALGTSTETCAGQGNFTVPADGPYEIRAVGSRHAGAGTITINAGNLRVSVDDVGTPSP